MSDPIGITATLAHLRKINAPERPCILCGAMTTGSVGVAGIVWSNICPPCKSAEDAALWASLQRQTKQDFSGGVESRNAEWPSGEACQSTRHVRNNPAKGLPESSSGSECFDPNNGMVDLEDTSSGSSAPPTENLTGATEPNLGRTSKP